MSMTAAQMIERLKLFPDHQEVRVIVEGIDTTGRVDAGIEAVTGLSWPRIILEP